MSNRDHIRRELIDWYTDNYKYVLKNSSQIVIIFSLFRMSSAFSMCCVFVRAGAMR